MNKLFKIEHNIISSSRRRFHRGAVILELSICITLLSLLLLGFFQYGQILYYRSRLNQMLRETGLYASRHWSDNNFTANYTTVNSLQYYMYNLVDIKDANNVQNGSSINDYPFKFEDLIIPSNFISPTPGTTDKTGAQLCQSGKFMTITVQYDMSKAYIWKSAFPGLGSSFIVTKSVTVLMY